MKVGIISDIHEDISSLKETITSLEKYNCSDIVCLGDLTGVDTVYYKDISSQNASGCIEIIRSNCRYVVAGNHDFYSVKRIPEVFSRMDLPNNWYDLEISDRKKLYRKKVWLYDNEAAPYLSDSDKEYLCGLPEYLIANFGGVDFFLSHSTYPDFTGSIVHRPYNPWDLHTHFQFLDKHNCFTGLAGHMHSRGLLKITSSAIKLLSFGVHKIEKEHTQYFCPCLSNSTSKRGFLVLETDSMSIEAVRYQSKNKKWFALYEGLRKKYKL